MTTLEARIAEVIAGNDKAHAFRMADYSDNERPIYRCACGVEAIGMHHKHHRKALAAALLAMTREAQAEAAEKAVAAVRNIHRPAKFEDSDLRHCVYCDRDDRPAYYPCPTITALDTHTPETETTP